MKPRQPGFCKNENRPVPIPALLADQPGTDGDGACDTPDAKYPQGPSRTGKGLSYLRQLSEKGIRLKNGVGLVTTKYADFDVELRLESGRLLGPLRIAYETYGTLNKDASNVILANPCLDRRCACRRLSFRR